MIEPRLDRGLVAQLKGLVDQADLNSVPGGVLCWFGDTTFPDAETPQPSLRQSAFESIYQRVAAGSIGGTVPHLRILEASVIHASAECVALVLAVFDVCRPMSRFTDDVQRAAGQRSKLAAPPHHLTDVLTTSRVCLASAIQPAQFRATNPTHRGTTVDFCLSSCGIVLGPNCATPESIEFDAGDGRGFRPVVVDETMRASYPAAGTYTAQLRASIDGAVRTLPFVVDVSALAPPPAPDETWGVDGGTAWVYRCAGRPRVQHPVVIAEGFPGGSTWQVLHDLVAQAGLLDGLREAGYDVVLVGFTDGTRRIQDNAGVVRQVIARAHVDTDESMVVGGVSMGGLVTRYALAEMEHEGADHRTAVYLSIDTPHGRGAYTALSAQWFAHSFAAISPAIAEFGQLIDAVSNQQFMMSWVRNGEALESPLRTEFLADLRRVGWYPQRPRKLALSCGRGDGVSAGDGSVVTLDWTGSPFVGARLESLPTSANAVVASGWSPLLAAEPLPDLIVDTDVSWELVPGGQNVYNAIAAGAAAAIGCGTIVTAQPVSCSVPTVSALDLDIHPCAPVPAPGSVGSPFDDYLCCDTNQIHLTITPAMSAWIIEQLGAPTSRTKEAAPS